MFWLSRLTVPASAFETRDAETLPRGGARRWGPTCRGARCRCASAIDVCMHVCNSMVSVSATLMPPEFSEASLPPRLPFQRKSPGTNPQWPQLRLTYGER
ncbi:hypothetical protein HETIRDRAFT_415790 [Heterobasidion irregulare TC 32-1]|uniref:Uncharacterized protein n=1 Tax=Heterobasidion irregulare (strain TC 32-1) TaxID=747525 RepID=W4KFI2_HETIT|nr:uncharacterized protein HETIRDRAFT_415790 [Heterobasidion irregulare TC 32-1]ETW84075.1 hypothetical protein HETIRDRAFT_415790 [Heterobasidion irregulare TC 32-1]